MKHEINTRVVDPILKIQSNVKRFSKLYEERCILFTPWTSVRFKTLEKKFRCLTQSFIVLTLIFGVERKILQLRELVILYSKTFD